VAESIGIRIQNQKMNYHTEKEKMVRNALVGYCVKDGLLNPK
jgi:hypothetical protein